MGTETRLHHTVLAIRYLQEPIGVPDTCVVKTGLPCVLEAHSYSSREHVCRIHIRISYQDIDRGKGDGQQGGGSPGEPAEGQGVADSDRCWGCSEQSFLGCN